MTRDTDHMDQHRVYCCLGCQAIQKQDAGNRKCIKCGQRTLQFVAKVFVDKRFVVEVFKQ